MVAYKLVAHPFQSGHHHIVEQMMPLYIQISGLCCYSQSLYILFHSQVGSLGIGIFVLELPYLPCHLSAQLLYVRISCLETEVAHFYDMVEIGNSELSINSFPVKPYAPHEQRENSLAVKTQILFKIEDGAVVQRNSNAHIVQAGGIALQVFDGVCIGVKHVRTMVYGARHRRGTLQEIVVVGIYTGYHTFADIFRNQIHQHRAFSLRQCVARRKHYFKITVLVLETAKCRAPKEYIVVRLHIRHYPLSRIAPIQVVGRIKVSRRQIVL